MIRTFTLGAAAWLLLAGTAMADIRLYKIDDDGYEEGVMQAINTDDPGCHDLLFDPGVHRVAQVRFAWCSVYREESCREGSEIPGRWKGKEEPVVKFTPGALWVLDEGNVSVASWRCEK